MDININIDKSACMTDKDEHLVEGSSGFHRSQIIYEQLEVKLFSFVSRGLFG